MSTCQWQHVISMHTYKQVIITMYIYYKYNIDVDA